MVVLGPVSSGENPVTVTMPPGNDPWWRFSGADDTLTVRRSMIDAPFQIAVTEVAKGDLSYRVAVITPLRRVTFGREKLTQVNAGTELSAVDRWLIREIANCEATMTVFRSVDDAGDRMWSVDPSLDEDEKVQLGYLLVRGLLPVHRRLLRAGIVFMVHSDWGFPEMETMRGGVARMIEVLEHRPRAHPAVQEADLWILKNLIFHFSMPYERIVGEILPERLRSVELRAARTKELVARLPSFVLD